MTFKNSQTIVRVVLKRKTMTLTEYITSKELSQAKFGSMLNPPVTQGLVSQWINGMTRITLDQAIQIEQITGNEVTVRECASLYKQAA